MKAFLLSGSWEHKRTQKKHDFHFVIITEDNEKKPMKAFERLYDLSGVTLLKSVINPIDYATAFPLKA